MTLFVESAFKHGYDESDFYEILESTPLKLRSKRDLLGFLSCMGAILRETTCMSHTVWKKNGAPSFTCGA